MMDPKLWQSLPFRDTTAWIDFLGQHSRWHQVLAQSIFAKNGKMYRIYPLGDGGGQEWHLAHQDEHIGAANALGLAAPPDFSSYNLSDPTEFASWVWLHAEEHIRLRTPAGIV